MDPRMKIVNHPAAKGILESANDTFEIMSTRGNFNLCEWKSGSLKLITISASLTTPIPNNYDSLISELSSSNTGTLTSVDPSCQITILRISTFIIGIGYFTHRNMKPQVSVWRTTFVKQADPPKSIPDHSGDRSYTRTWSHSYIHFHFILKYRFCVPVAYRVIATFHFPLFSCAVRASTVPFSLLDSAD